MENSADESTPRSFGYRFLRALLWGACLALLGEIARMVFTHNEHTILEGRAYRTAQLNPRSLRKFIKKHEIKTVVNLRGRPISDWYPAESRTTQELVVGQEDVTLSACRLPAPSEIHRLIHVLDRVEYPILIHCQQGADRTGLASAIVLLLYSDATYDEARKQCSPRFGHFPIFHTKEMDRFFAMYEAWLSNRAHSPDLFRGWALHHYQPGNAIASLELMATRSKCQLHNRVSFCLKATNKSREPWYFHESGQRQGVTVRYVVECAAKDSGVPKRRLAKGFANNPSTVRFAIAIRAPSGFPRCSRPNAFPNPSAVPSASCRSLPSGRCRFANPGR